MARGDVVNDGPPAKRARPTSVEDEVVERAGQGAAALKSGRGALTLEEVCLIIATGRTQFVAVAPPIQHACSLSGIVS